MLLGDVHDEGGGVVETADGDRRVEEGHVCLLGSQFAGNRSEVAALPVVVDDLVLGGGRVVPDGFLR